MTWDLTRGLILNVTWPQSDASTATSDQNRPLRIVISGGALRSYEAGDRFARADADQRFERWIGEQLENFMFSSAAPPLVLGPVVEWQLDAL